MGQSKYLIDTNAIIDFLGKKFHEKGMIFMNDVIDSNPNISVISKIEILGFKTTNENTALLFDFINDCIVFDLNEEVVNYTIDL